MKRYRIKCIREDGTISYLSNIQFTDDPNMSALLPLSLVNRFRALLLSISVYNKNKDKYLLDVIEIVDSGEAI